jgi:hypothetical protein
MRLEGTAHSAGWITELPSPYQEIFGKDLIYGYASNISINGRIVCKVRETSINTTLDDDYILNTNAVGSIVITLPILSNLFILV